MYGPQRRTGNLTYDEIWKHVYHPLRLQIIDKEKTVQGKVARIKKEPDGDYHMWLDSGQECEIICACKITQHDAIIPCQGYTNAVKIPNVGDNVTVTGSYVYDLVHKQYQIHPIFSIK